MSVSPLRQSLSAPGLLQIVRRCFARIADPKPSTQIPLVDHLLSGLAIFGLKYPSLLQFDQDRELIASNLHTLYGVSQIPSDTYLRERLDEVDPKSLRRAFSDVFAALQRGKGLEGMGFMDGYYLLSLDGTGYFSSKRVHCKQCCEKHHRDGQVTYYHQLLGAVLVHPDESEVFPLAPEPILKQDGAKKNDCERNAAKRLLRDVRRTHPHLKLVVVEDGLASNGPHIELLQSLNMRFILGAKESDHGFLFDWVAHTKETRILAWTDDKGVHHRFRYLNHAPLNEAHFDLAVNFLEYWETLPSGKVQHFSWVTDILITDDNVMLLMRGGRARWRIENETYNTLKNQGYHFEHNFGHGHQHLATVFAYLMMLSFLIDQVQQRCCQLFRQAWKAKVSKKNLWEKLRTLFHTFEIPSWEALYQDLAYRKTKVPFPDTS